MGEKQIYYKQVHQFTTTFTNAAFLILDAQVYSTIIKDIMVKKLESSNSCEI